MARVWVNINRAIDELSVEYTLFKDPHPDQAQQIEAMGKALLIVQSMVEDFWREAWGELPTDIHSWV